MPVPDTLQTVVDFAPPQSDTVDLLVVAGEHSGDEHVAKVVAELIEADPDYRVACLGGVELEAAGAQLLYDLTAVSIVGFVEVVKHYSFFKDLFERTLDWIEKYRPKQVCFVDYPGFNLRLADQLYRRGLSCKGGGEIVLSYYIGPQIWAWKAKRRFKMAQLLDQLGVIFPFEVDCYKDTDLKVDFVGHPFLRKDYKAPFVYDCDAPVLLLPGSRQAAVSRIFPLLLDGFKEAVKEDSDLRALVVYPSEKIYNTLTEILDTYPELMGKVEFCSNEEKGILASSVLMSSGTMSLAVALSGIPGAIAYRLNPISYWMGRFLVKIPYIGIANLLLNRALHREYIQGDATPTRLSQEILEARTEDAGNRARQSADELTEILDPERGIDVVTWLGNSE